MHVKRSHIIVVCGVLAIGTYIGVQISHIQRDSLLDGLPLALVFERPSAPAQSLGAEWSTSAWKKLSGLLLIGLGALLLFALVVISKLRSAKAEETNVKIAPPPAPVIKEVTQEIDQQPPGDAMQSIMLPGVSRAIEAFDDASASRLRALQDEGAILVQFEKEITKTKDPKIVHARMTTVASRLCASPCLFFAYHEVLRGAVLEAVAGMGEKGGADALMGASFQVDQSVWQKISQAESQGHLVPLADYEPLSRLILIRTGVAHFEAWGVTGYGYLGRLAGKPRLLGILVILQSGVDSVTRHDSLSRMVRMAGLVYENALLSQ
jgi:hypothetical protein